MRVAALIVLTVAACGGSKPPPPPPPAPDPIPTTAAPDCNAVADKLAIVLHADAPDAQAAAKSELRTRCRDDKWSDAARSCFGTVESDAELDGCRQHLDDAQKSQLAKLAPGGEATPAAAPAPAPPKSKAHTRGAQQKGDSSDPQEGGE
jgi:hypothetical protein